MERGHMNLHRHHCHLWFFLSGFPLLTYSMYMYYGGALIMDTFFQLVNFILKIVN